MTHIVSSYELIGQIVRQTFGVAPEVMAALAHGDEEVRLRRLPETTRTTDPHDGVEVFVRRVVANAVAMRNHRGTIKLHTELQARAAGWPTARLADMATVLAWALGLSSDQTLSVPLLVEADEDARDGADGQRGDLPLPTLDALCAQFHGNSGAVTGPAVEQVEEVHPAASACKRRRLVRLDALALDWFGIDAVTISLPSDAHDPKMKGANARAIAVFVWLINEALDLGSDLRREMIEAVRVKTDADAAVAGEPGAAASNAALLLGAAIRHGGGWTVHVLQPRVGAAATLAEAGSQLQEERRRVGHDDEAKTAIYYEARDIAAREHIHVGRRNIGRVAWRLIEPGA